MTLWQSYFILMFQWWLPNTEEEDSSVPIKAYLHSLLFCFILNMTSLSSTIVFSTMMFLFFITLNNTLSCWKAPLWHLTMNFFSGRKQSVVTYRSSLITEKSWSQWWRQIKLESQRSGVRVTEWKIYFDIKDYLRHQCQHFCFLGQGLCIQGLPTHPVWNISVLWLFINGTLFAESKGRCWESKQLLKSRHWREIVRIFGLLFNGKH